MHAGDVTSTQEHFLADHRRLEERLERLRGAFEADDRERIAALWPEFESALLAHLEAEERRMIPALARDDEATAKALLDEHAQIRSRIAELGLQVDLHTARASEASALADDLEAHARREDAALYAWSDKHLDEAARRTLVEALETTVRHVLHRAPTEGKHPNG